MDALTFAKDKIQSGLLFKHWERDYSIFFLTMTARSHVLANAPELGEDALSLVLFSYKNGFSSYYRPQTENDRLFATVGEKCKYPHYCQALLENYEHLGEAITRMNAEIEAMQTVNKAFVAEYIAVWQEMVAYQLFVHRLIDYFVQIPESDELMARFTRARTAYEKLFGFFEQSFGTLRTKVAAQFMLPDPEALRLVTCEEFMTLFDGGSLPPDLEARNELTVISVFPELALWTGDEAHELLRLIDENLHAGGQTQVTEQELRGLAVYGQGVIQGVVAVVTDYTQLESFEPGKILVTPSTLPKYHPYYQKAKAIITDEGGLLSHAAILCRESKIPGIVGTKLATKVLHTNMPVILDFERNTVRFTG